jgi:hypothetical protein
VRQLFGALYHAGEPTGTAPVVSGEAGREQRGTRVRFMLQLCGERVLQARYRAYGCPYTLAACEWLATRLESAGRGSLGAPPIGCSSCRSRRRGWGGCWWSRMR